MTDIQTHTDYLAIEKQLWIRGYSAIAGVDEVGRGPIAGPVVAAAVILVEGSDITGVVDSKQMTSIAREQAFELILHYCRAFSVGAASVRIIDTIGIAPATRLAMQRALIRLPIKPDYVIVDGLFTPQMSMPGESIVKGDSRSRSIAAASVVAKVVRDRLMTRLATVYPGIGFDQHKGYGTAAHIEYLKKFGPTRHHRLSFAPLRQMVLDLTDE